MKFVCVVCLCLVSVFADAAEISFANAWARATPPGARTGAAYFVLNNSGKADRLVSAKSAVAEKSEIHTHVAKDGMMRMQHLPQLEIAAGGGVVFEPGGLHVMLIGLHGPLRAGEEFTLTLVFEAAGEIEITVSIVDARKDVP